MAVLVFVMVVRVIVVVLAHGRMIVSTGAYFSPGFDVPLNSPFTLHAPHFYAQRL